MPTTLAGFATSVNPATDIITAYSAAPYMPSPVPDPSPFVVIGAFTVPATITGRLQVLGLVVGTAVCTVALYDPTQVVSVVVASSQEQETLSEKVTLSPGKTYQVAVQFLGTTDPTNIAVVRTVSLVP